MIIDDHSAIVDADFLNHIAEMYLPKEEIADIVRRIFRALDVNAVIHPLVYEKEIIQTNIVIAELLNKQIIWVATFDDILGANTERKSYYEYLLKDLYYRWKGIKLDTGSKSVFEYWKRRDSLGELHSLSTCIICSCSIFLSDDHGSKQLAQIIETSVPAHIHVYKREEIIPLLPEKLLSRKEERSFSHAIESTYEPA